RPYHHRMHVDASPFRADVAKEVREIRIDLIERAGKSRHHLPAAQERNLRYALELDGAIEREVLVPVHAAYEAPVGPRLRQEKIRLRTLGGASFELRRIVVDDQIVGYRVEIGAERQPRRDLPLVLGAPVATQLSFLEDLVDEESVHAAFLVARDDVTILGCPPETQLLVGGERQGGVLTVGDHPVERDLGKESLPVGLPH